MLENSNHKNSICTFAETSIGYLYGEISAEEKFLFESHLMSCEKCAEEFAGLSAVHSSVIEWRDLEFANLTTPVIEIPYEQNRILYSSTNDKKFTYFSFAKLRSYFALKPAFAASAVLALILLSFGIVFFAAKSSNQVETASKVSDQIEKSNVSPIKNLDEAAIKETKLPSVEAKNENQKAVPELKSPHQNPIVKIASNSRNVAKNTAQETVVAHKIKPVNIENNQTYAKAVKLPRLNNFDEVEDKSLRLADLLEDDNGGK